MHPAFLMVRETAAHGWNDSKIDCYSIGRLIPVISRCQLADTSIAQNTSGIARVPTNLHSFVHLLRDASCPPRSRDRSLTRHTGLAWRALYVSSSCSLTRNCSW